MVGGLYYTAPEAFDGECDEKCDIWACGVILHVMLCGCPPFEARKKQDLMDKIRSQGVGFTGSTFLIQTELGLTGANKLNS